MQRKLIGFDRRLDKEWLDAAAAFTLAGMPAPTVRENLKGLLESEQGAEALQKTLTVIGRLWWLAPQDLAPMQARALELLPAVSPPERVAIHWALCLAVYPLFLDTARLTGRLLSLQSEVKLQQLDVRVAELWGDRGAIPRSVRRIVRSMVQWGVLQDTNQPGVYVPAKMIAVRDDVGALLLEGLLRGQDNESIPGELLHGHPTLFPLAMNLRPFELRGRPEFEVQLQGLDMEYIQLRH